MIADSSDVITFLQVLLSLLRLSITTANRRMHLIASAMHKDALSSLVEISKELASRIIRSGNEVDRFSLYISKNLVLASHNRHQLNQIGLKTTSDCQSYRIAIKRIERIGTHASGIAEKCLELKERLAVEVASTISKIGELSLSVLRDSLGSLLQRNYELADKKVDRSHYVYPLEENVVAHLQKTKEVRYHYDSLLLVLENIVRTAEYTSDIAETAINETINETMESKKGGGDKTHE
jgi:phosphate uptake regulator